MKNTFTLLFSIACLSMNAQNTPPTQSTAIAKVGINEKEPPTHFYVNGSSGAKVHTFDLAIDNNIDVSDKSIIAITTSDPAVTTFTATGAVDGQVIIVINTLDNTFIILDNANGTNYIPVTYQCTQSLVFYEGKWYRIGKD